MYSQVLVSIFKISPMFTNNGTWISKPVSNFAGFPEVVVVFPTMKVIFGLFVLAVILLVGIIYIKYFDDKKKKYLYYLVGLEIIIVILMIIMLEMI